MPQIKASTFSHFKDIPLGTHKVVIKRRMKLARNKKSIQRFFLKPGRRHFFHSRRTLVGTDTHFAPRTLLKKLVNYFSIKFKNGILFNERIPYFSCYVHLTGLHIS